MTLATVGYGSFDSPHHLKDFLNSTFGERWSLVDIRYVPYSKHPEWRASALTLIFGNRYRWLRAWGNAGRFEGGGVQIADYEAGAGVVRSILEQGRVVVLMCQCPSVGGCHRRVVAEQFAGETGVQVVHLKPAAWSPDQLQLIE